MVPPHLGLLDHSSILLDQQPTKYNALWLKSAKYHKGITESAIKASSHPPGTFNSPTTFKKTSQISLRCPPHKRTYFPLEGLRGKLKMTEYHQAVKQANPGRKKRFFVLLPIIVVSNLKDIPLIPHCMPILLMNCHYLKSQLW